MEGFQQRGTWSGYRMKKFPLASESSSDWEWGGREACEEALWWMEAGLHHG